MTKIAHHTLGCKLNYAETSTYMRGFSERGLEVIPWDEAMDADIYLINTCSVTEKSDQKARGVIRKMHRRNPSAAIIVTGCYAQLKPSEIRQIEGVTMVFGAKDKPIVVQAVMDYLEGHKVSPEDYKRKEIMSAYSTGERTRGFLKVQDGCNNYCAYCTVPYARGESRNIPICEAVKEASLMASTGIKEIVITGVNTGDYGRTTGESFLDLLKALNDVEGIQRYRISSIEPNLITEEIVDWIASGTKILPHFHIPLQQGTDEILKSMGRKYDTEFFRHRIEMIRSKLEGPGKAKVFFGIDLMAGLPGETEELFQRSYDFIADIKPAFIHIFPYSRRPGTPAALMRQVQDSVKTERVERLEVLCRQLHDEFVQANKGLPEKVLFESKDKDGMMSGYTGNYIRVSRPYDETLVGQIVDVTI